MSRPPLFVTAEGVANDLHRGTEVRMAVEHFFFFFFGGAESPSMDQWYTLVPVHEDNHVGGRFSARTTRGRSFGVGHLVALHLGAKFRVENVQLGTGTQRKHLGNTGVHDRGLCLPGWGRRLMVFPFCKSQMTTDCCPFVVLAPP
jgi:hypothetical protein